ncbi:DDE family endonuclease (macronuclear) [Tetrahymena thermophila SB210]|uniref:DDE family endonuclease n=1 Tax=Tetrahymena thermophila (strain SB210) TaxID=312017 RepID=Q245P5_TETTS|nr:DDE family endonuclease [Tetrahymena thermophila SB210]EAS03588.2 DDE family endonuclease [Tetrahymena thermophila SB210]|eukprot:XP_001023833.2 DDE family endonuclease [Tetrahymena thermophila SB210]
MFSQLVIGQIIVYKTQGYSASVIQKTLKRKEQKSSSIQSTVFLISTQALVTTKQKQINCKNLNDCLEMKRGRRFFKRQEGISISQHKTFKQILISTQLMLLLELCRDFQTLLDCIQRLFLQKQGQVIQTQQKNMILLSIQMNGQMKKQGKLSFQIKVNFFQRIKENFQEQRESKLQKVNIQLDRKIQWGREIMVWGMINYYGGVSLVRIDSPLNADGYIQILENNQLSNFNTDKNIFQNDNCPCHKSKKVRKFLEKH